MKRRRITYIIILKENDDDGWMDGWMMAKRCRTPNCTDSHLGRFLSQLPMKM
jgi:hypothetical protein